MNTGRRVLKNFLSLSISEIITRLGGAVLTIYIARILGVGIFGQFAFATAFVSILNIFADFGFSILGIREIARDKTKTAFYGTNILVLQLGLSTILLLILFLILLFIHIDIKIKIITFLFGLSMVPAALNMSYIFQAHEKMEYTALSNIFFQIGYVGLGFLLIYFLKNILVLPILSFFVTVAVSITIIYLLKKQIKFHWGRIDWRCMKRLFREAIPFLVSALMGQLIISANLIFLQFMHGEEMVGWFGAPYKIILLILTASGFFFAPIFPILSSSYKQNREYFNKLVRFSARIMGLCALPLTVAGFMLSKDIIGFIFGSGYNESVMTFSILIFLPIFMFINGTFSHALSSSGNQKIVMNTTIIAAIICIALNFLLIPNYGINGAAVAALIAQISAFIYIYLAQRNILKLHILGIYFEKPFIASLIMALALYSLPSYLHLLLKITFLIIVYFISLIVIKGIRYSDFIIIKRALSKTS